MISRTMIAALLASVSLAAPALAQGAPSAGRTADQASSEQNPAMNAGNQTYITSPEGKKIPLDTGAIGSSSSGGGASGASGGSGGGKR